MTQQNDRLRSSERKIAGRFRSRLRDSSGISILEQALVYPLLLGIVIGAVDVSRILQGYSVLDQGLRSALRCATPANGECISPVSRDIDALYDIYEQSDRPAYRVQQHQYRGEAGWLALPIHQIESIEAAVVESAEYPVVAYNHTYQLEQFRPYGSVGFALETRSFPLIDLNPQGSLVPRLLRAGGSSALATLTLAAPDVSVRYRAAPLPGQRNRLKDSVRFTIEPSMLFDAGVRDLRSGEGCFKSADDQGRVPDFKRRCGSAELFQGAQAQRQIESTRQRLSSSADQSGEGSQYAFIVLDIRGHAITSAADRGAVQLKISQPGGISRMLGGRLLAVSGESHFVPRGAPVTHYSDAFRQRYAQEIQDHQAIMVKLGVPVEIEFSIVPDSPDVEHLEWHADRISIFAPHYRSATALAECDTLISRPRFERDRSSACSGSLHAAGPPRPETIVLPAQPSRVLSEVVCTSAGAGDAASLLSERGVPEAQDYRALGLPSSSACGESLAHQTCPDNHGDSALELSEGSLARTVCNSAEAAALCPLPVGTALDAKACWTVRARSLAVDQLPRWTQMTCSQKTPTATQLPAELRGYAALRVRSHRIPGEEQRLYTNGTFPTDFVSANPDYRCSEIEPRVVAIGKDLTPLKAQSLFRRTSALGADFEQLLFQDAQVNFVNPSENISAAAFFRATEQVNSVLTSVPPEDPAQVYWVEPGDAPRWNLIAQRVKAEHLPSACSIAGTICRRELVGVARNTEDRHRPDLLPERGEELGYQAIAAALPALQRQCHRDSRACAEIQLEEEHDQHGKLFVARGELRIPLILSPKPFTISRVERGRWERDLVDRRG